MNTPRTDAALIDNGELVGQFPEWVRADFARQLETEVQELRNQLEEMLDCAEGRAPLTVGTCNAARAILARTGGK